MFLMYVVPSLCTVGAGGTIFFMRRRNRIEIKRMEVDLDAAKAAAKSADIAGDVNVIDLYKRVYADLSVTLKEEHNKLVEKQGSLEQLIGDLSKKITMLERAIKSVSRCKYARNCPVTKELEKLKKDEK